MNKGKLLLTASLFFSLTLLLVNCDKKVGKREGAVVTPPPVGFCDTITFAKHINPIIVANCAFSGCHVVGGSGNGDFTIYAGIKAKVSSGAFANRVFNASNPMPASGLLPQKQLDLIKCWIDKGALND